MNIDKIKNDPAAFAAAWFKAVCQQDMPAVRALFPLVRNIDLRDAEGKTAFMHAVIKKLSGTTIFTLDNGADVNAQDNQGRSILHYFAWNYKVFNNFSRWAGTASEISGYVYKKGLNPDLQDADGNTALHLAVKNNRSSEILFILSRSGANPEIRNKDKLTPKELAQTMGEDIAVSALDKIEHIWEQQKEKIQLELAAQRAAESSNEAFVKWVITGDGEISCIENKPAIFYRLTHIFNFKRGLYAHIACNTETKAETKDVLPFDQIGHVAMLLEAAEEMTRLDPDVKIPSFGKNILMRATPLLLEKKQV